MYQRQRRVYVRPGGRKVVQRFADEVPKTDPGVANCTATTAAAYPGGKYPKECLQQWWQAKGCSTDVNTISAGAAANSKDFTDKAYWNARNKDAVGADMAAWANNLNDTNRKGCYGTL